MATKTFKIGLSNTDKQNMAQDVYERVLALTFAEYDSANTYNKGDFVVYDDTLYQCKQDNTTGAWDSSKWQQATLQDLLNDIEGAVAFVNDKANVDGNYPTMTVGAADNLTPYDEDSGVDQEQSFLLQGTGCGNGEQQVDTGALGLLKEKQGHTVVVNQLAKSLSIANWGIYGATGSIVDGVVSITATEEYGRCVQVNVPIIANHKYFMSCDMFLTSDTDDVALNLYYADKALKPLTSGWHHLQDIVTVSTSGNVDFRVIDNRSSGWDEIKAKNIILIDLTQWFGSNNNIPAHLLAHPEDFFRYYQGSLAYNEGELVNANGRYLKTIGRNQWDEEWENGVYSYNDGEKSANPNYLRNKNPIKVIPNTDYYFKTNGTDNMVLFYDKDGGFIGYDGVNLQFKTPSNCCYVCFYTNNATYNNDITISIYYDGESGYDQYYPYEELANIDTGTEVLRSAGSVKDSKAPDGAITRRVGVVDLSTLSWEYIGTYNCWLALLAGIKNHGQGVSDKYLCKDVDGEHLNEGEFSLYWGWLGGNSCIVINNGSNSVSPTGTLNYELAEPTTEQGTSFSENIVIDDFGSMDFGGTSGVPQGASIFYAVDYKAFIDSLYNTLDGDATDIVKESELDSKLATLGYVKLTSVSGYDATKTQVLKNVEGTLTWVTEE